MTPDRWTRVEALFAEAADRPPADRPAFLDRAARDAGGDPDPDLREEVERLLALDAGAGRFFDGFAEGGLHGASPGAPERVGPWRLVREIGQGGMGTVYLAERADGAFEQRAAVKLVRPGLADDLAARFRAERHVLARLEHPGIARVLDGGTAPDGRPYLALEYVDGEPITAFADRAGLGVDARLRLFGQVCAAVQHAHRRLVVHRDLKPSNVLVAGGDHDADGGREAPRVKLLDFGIAKLLDGDADATATGTTPRTPAYAAPEQVRGDEITTAADVYALGVLLYELLAGARPHAGGGRRRAAVERAVLEEAPAPPSAAVTAEAAAARGTEASRLRRRLAGDLDQIVLTALRKDPDARYASAAALRDDVGRHLARLPVEARPASRWVRARAFVRRHRAGVAGAAAGVLALAVGLGGAVWQGRVAAAERDRAEQAAAFMVDLLGEFDPNQAAPGRLDAGGVLDLAVARVEAGLAEQPDVQARLYDHIGETYQSYARFDDAERLLSRALRLRRALYGEAHRETAESLTHLAWLRFVRGEYAAADSLYGAALAALEALGARRSAEAAGVVEGLGLVQRALGDPEAAAARVREALALRQETLGPDHPDTVTSANTLAALLSALGRHDDAAALFRDVIAARRRTLGVHTQTAQALSDYGAVLVAQGDLPAALRAHREALALRRELLGDGHPHVAQSLSHLGWALQSQGRPAEAEPLYREALAIRQGLFGDDHTAVGNSRLLVGEALALQGDLPGGLAFAADAVRTFRRGLGPAHRTTLGATLRYAGWLAEAGRVADARAALRDALPACREVFGPDHPKTRDAEALLARLDAPDDAVTAAG